MALAGTDDGVETWTFDVCTNAWTQMHPNREPPDLGELVYDVDSDLTVGASWGEGASPMWAYDLGANTWTEKGRAPAGFPSLRLRFYDPVSGLVVATGEDGDARHP